MPGVGQPVSTLQGVPAQNVSIDPQAFFPATRRLTYAMQSVQPIAGLGSTDTVQLRQTGIIAALDVRIAGTITFGGTITGTTMSWRWPYNLFTARVSANGQANLINAPGLLLQALSMTQGQITDRGVQRAIGAGTPNQGTLARASDSWGSDGTNELGPGVTVAAAGTYDVDFVVRIPLAFDQRTLLGAVFAQTAQTNLVLDLDYAPQSELLTLGGAATFAHALTWEVAGVVYTIPQVGGRFVVPDLSAFHQFVATGTNAVGQGENELMLPGTGIGRQLMRVYGQVYTGAAPGVPLAVNAANYGPMGWRYGGNDTPEMHRTGSSLRSRNEETTGVDLGGQWGIWAHDFASEWALRDAVDEGATSDLRLVVGLQAAPATPRVVIAQQTIFAAPVGA